MKKKLVVLGCGFSAFRFLKKINTNLYDVTVISPRNHFLFTPLLPSTTVGTLEFRSIIEPVRNLKDVTFHQAFCTKIIIESNKLLCEDNGTRKEFEVNYDYLVISVGEVTNTFGIEGVNEYSLSLKELSDARKIRTKVIDCFEKASLPGLSDEEKRILLRFVVCGGGPTGVEFAAELHDFIEEDVKRKYKYLSSLVEIILVEARDSILETFDRKLRDYTMKIFKRQNIILKLNSLIDKVNKQRIHLNDNTEIDFGLLVWATGNTATEFVKSSGFQTDRRGKIPVNNYFRVLKSLSDSNIYENIFAIGDCTVMVSGELPATAQVAQQQGFYLAKYFNKNFKNHKPFSFKNLGMLAYIGGHKALADIPQFKGTGFTTFLFWRSAYLTKLVSLKNKILVIFDWTKTLLFGRDVSNF